MSGYFDSRQRLWEEPIYRNVFGLLREFGDAEIASLIAPRALIVEYSKAPQVDGPPKPRTKKPEAAPGKIATPDYSSVEAEFERARALLHPGDPKLFDRAKLISGTEGMATGPGSDRALIALLTGLGVSTEELKLPGQAPSDLRTSFDPDARQYRQVMELEEHTQKLLRDRSVSGRSSSGRSSDRLASCLGDFLRALQTDPLGRGHRPAVLPCPSANPRTRHWEPAAAAPAAPAQITSTDPGQASARDWTGYEVVLDVFPRRVRVGDLARAKGHSTLGNTGPWSSASMAWKDVPPDVIAQDPTRRRLSLLHAATPHVWRTAASSCSHRTILIGAKTGSASCSARPTHSGIDLLSDHRPA